ncbi:MAG: RteC domain-containing protein [Bacteroidetes bacterium]|nr:RteC domain-containing protein [Bacteroidota bacterium]
MKNIAKTIAKYQEEVKIIENSNKKEEQKIRENIQLTKDCLHNLRLQLRQAVFNGKESEINFFKYQKPLVYGNLKFFVAVLTYLTEKPNGCLKEQKEFLSDSFKKMEAKKKRNIEFFKYYQHNENCLDDKYFVRGNNQLELFSNVLHLDSDPEFSTSHDIKAAEVIAYELMAEYYANALVKLKQKSEVPAVQFVKPEILNNLSWTASKTDLVELIYALNAAGAVKNGQAEIKKMAQICKELFGIDLKNFYKTYGEIKARNEDELTKFLDHLKESLTRKVESEL